MHPHWLPKNGVIKYSDFMKNGGNYDSKPKYEEEKEEVLFLPKVEKKPEVFEEVKIPPIKELPKKKKYK